jgi:PAS domain S-box-containing protein
MIPQVSFLTGGGEMGALMRAYDWARTPLGTPDTWPQALRTALRLLLNTGHPMYIWWGPALLCFYNDAYRQSIGSERHPSSLGRPAREVWEEIWPIIGPEIELVVSGRGSVSHENALVPITRNGVVEQVYWTYTYGPLDDESAPLGIGGVLVICSETTAHVLASRRANEERERFADLFEQAPTFMAVLRGPEHRFELANPRYRHLVGDRDVLGRTVAEALPDAVAQGYLQLLDEVYHGGHPYVATALKYEMQVDPSEPVKTRYVDFVYHPIRDVAGTGTVTGIFVVGSDVTDRVSGELALAASEARFRTFADNIPMLCWMADESGAIFWYNSRWYEYTGTTPEQMRGWGWQAVHDPIVLPDVLVRWRASIAAGSPFEMVFPLKSAGGAFRPFLSRIVPSCDAAGRLTGWFGTNTDISHQMDAEKALREADRRKDEFLAILAHELRNPLAPVRSAAKVLRAPLADAKTRDWATAVIDRQIHTMASLLDDLLDVSRITRGHLVLHKQKASISSILETSLEVARPLVESRHHTLSISLPDTPIEVDGDPLRLSQVFSNLLTNAAKYSEPSGRIDVTVAQAAEGIEVSVKDSGLGLEAESLSRIFEMFSQVKSALERSEGGLGIGLALVKGIVELHGGRVSAFSEGLGHGSEFRVLLPRATASQKASRADAQLIAGPARIARKILVVDDNKDAAQTLGLLLELAGHAVSFAYDGEQALVSANDLRPDVVLLDIGLPKLNGYAVAQGIRAESWGEKMILIALTGWGHEDDKRRALDAGFDCHLTKPVNPDEVDALIP